MSVALSRVSSVIAVAALCAVVAACDKDPNQPTATLALVSCPAGLLLVNAPITLDFSQDLSVGSITSGNVVVTDAVTGFEIPGSVRLGVDNPRRVVFTPSEPLPFDQAVRVRVQNILSADNVAALSVTVCNLRTELPPIRELYWRALPDAAGNTLTGLSLVEPFYAYAVARSNTLLRYTDTLSSRALPLPPYYNASNDASFVSRTHGFVTVSESRTRRGIILETFDGGATFDTIGAATAQVLNRAYFRAIPNATLPFGVVAGGQTFSPAYFMKYQPATKTFAVSSFGGTGGVSDLDFTPDTLTGAASTLGIKVGTLLALGTVFRSANGGTSWQEITNAKVTDSVVTLRGIAVKPNGEIFSVGGNGYVARLTPTGGGAYTVQRIVLPGVVNPQPTDPFALIFNDVQFVPGSNLVGFIVGARQVAVIGGVPRYEGLIFVTRDGGQTWTRQGVLGALNYGAEFPALNRIDVLSATAAWIVGDGGVVLRYVGATTP